MVIHRSVFAPLLILPLACTPAPNAGTDATQTTRPDTSTSASTGTPTSTAASTGVPTSTTANLDDDTGVSFIPEYDHPPGFCFLFEESCPEGEKCMPYGPDGSGVFDTFKCVPVVPDPDLPGEPCTVESSPNSGIDSCDKHAICWDVDPDTLTGTCFPMCVGDDGGPYCSDPTKVCLYSDAGVLYICYPECDPVAQDCPPGELCIPSLNPEQFRCASDASGDDGQVFDACEFANACDPGLTCAPPEFAAECDPRAIGCCLPFCAVSQQNTCPGAGQECVSWYAPDPAPPSHDDIGICRLPP